MKYRLRNQDGLLVLQVYAEQEKQPSYPQPPTRWKETEWVWRDAKVEDISGILFAEEPIQYQVTEVGFDVLRTTQRAVD